MTSKQTLLLEIARTKIGSNAWDINKKRISSDGKVIFLPGEPKCNLFLYEILVEAGIPQLLPNIAGRMASENLDKTGESKERPFVCRQWFNFEVPNMEFIGEGEEAMNKTIPGDIVTSGSHIGIISSYRKTISASTKPESLFLVVENEWGWREDEIGTMRVFRYRP